MLSRKPVAALFVTLLMLSGLAVAAESDAFTGRDQGWAATNFALTLPGSLPVAFESGFTDGSTFLNSSSHLGAWTLSIFIDGTEGYVLTAVVRETGGSGFAGVSLQSTTATREGYFGGPVALASNPEPTSHVAEPSTASFMFTGIFFAAGMIRRRVLAP